MAKMYGPGTGLRINGTEIANCTVIDGPDGSHADIDKTHLKSKAKEKGKGIPDYGSLNFTVNLDFAEPSHQALVTSFKNPNSDAYQIDFPEEGVPPWTCQANTNSFKLTGIEVDGLIQMEFTAAITGEVNFGT
ncbi:Hypothetical protein PBC10988_23120 [Planctomycetales bacterium 10988]|nr:Hypothetical protein PBC10988_23120 [Planctomycetales bacterium 10988]